MELVLDNIKMIHMNAKLVEYSKRQFLQSNLMKKLMPSQPGGKSGNEAVGVPMD